MRSITLTLDLDDPTTKLILLSLAADAKIPEKELPDKVAYLTEALGTENPEKPKKAAKKAPEKEPVVLPLTPTNQRLVSLATKSSSCSN